MKTLALQGRCSESHLTGGVWKHFTLCSACYLCFQNQKKKSDATCTACQAAKSLKPKLAISSTCDPPYWNEIMSAEVTMDYLLSYSILSLFEYALNWVQPWIPTMQKCVFVSYAFCKLRFTGYFHKLCFAKLWRRCSCTFNKKDRYRHSWILDFFFCTCASWTNQVSTCSRHLLRYKMISVTFKSFWLQSLPHKKSSFDRLPPEKPSHWPPEAV